LVDKDRSVKYVVCAGKNYEKNVAFREVHFWFEIQENKWVQFLAIRSEREKDQPSDQAKIKSRLSDLIGERSTMGRHYKDQEGN
jgi:hypothetical protein